MAVRSRESQLKPITGLSKHSMPTSSVSVHRGHAADRLGTRGQHRDRSSWLHSTGLDLLLDGRRPEDWPLERDPLALETSLPGVFAAGDVRHGSIKRVAGAVGEGGMAVAMAFKRLEELGLVV